MTVAVRCEECGKIYHIAPDKIKDKKQGVFRGRCSCSHVISFSLPTSSPEPDSAVLEALDEALLDPGTKAGDDSTRDRVEEPQQSADTQVDEHLAKTVLSGASAEDQTITTATTAYATSPNEQMVPEEATSKRGMGIRGKMMLLFMAIPLFLITLAGLLSQLQFKTLAQAVAEEATASIAKTAEETIIEKTNSVATQCRSYLSAVPKKKEALQLDADFLRLAVQKIGAAGYTFLLEEIGAGQPMSVVIAPDQMVGTTPQQFDEEFAKISALLKSGDFGEKKSAARYPWKDRSGGTRERFMVIKPVKDTPYRVLATTYFDEFTGPAKQLEQRLEQLRTRGLWVGTAVLLATLLLIFIIVFIFGNSLSGRIKRLTEVADRISVGDLDAEVPAQASDEVGQLAEAITRMQDSLRLSIQRLRRRR